VSSPAESTGAPARRGAGLKIALFAIGFRLFSALLALIVNVVFPDYTPAPFTVFGSASPFWDAFARYDSGWYYQVARYGYTAGAGAYVPDGRSGIAYFPAYPLLMRYVGRVIGRRPADLYIGGLVVSWTAFTLALIGIYYLARLDLPRRRAERAALLTAVFPFAFFFGAVYPEALFLAATVGCFYGFRTRRWILGGVSGAIATASRVNGIMMGPALIWIAWQEMRKPIGGASERASWPRPILGLALVGAGVGLYSLYIFGLTGNPFEWAAAIQRWGYYPGGSPVAAFVGLGRALLTHPYAFLAGERMAPYDSLNALAAFGAVVSVPFVWRKFGAAYGLFMLANLWLPLSSGQVEGMGRYVAVMFPLFIWLASLRTTVFVTTMMLFAMTYTLCMALFTNIHPLF
jgi:hypothetical protein